MQKKTSPNTLGGLMVVAKLKKHYVPETLGRKTVHQRSFDILR